MAIVPTLDARIGDTPIQFLDRYGTPKDTPSSKIYDKNSPVLEGAVHHTYEYQGWRIRAAFLQLDGPAVRMDFQELGPEIQIKEYEVRTGPYSRPAFLTSAGSNHQH